MFRYSDESEFWVTGVPILTLNVRKFGKKNQIANVTSLFHEIILARLQILQPLKSFIRAIYQNQ